MSKKGRVYFLFFAIIILAGCSLATIDQAVSRKRQGATNGVEAGCEREHRGSRRYCREGVTVVILKGSPWELGYARGTLLREEIQAWAKESLSEIEQLRTGRNVGEERLKENVAKLEAGIPAEFRRELEGLAAASGVDYSTLLLLNVWSNVDAGCASVAVTGHDGKLIRSRNYDWAPIRLLVPPIVFIYQPDNGYVFMSVHAPGLIGVATAMNVHGITLGSHALPGGRHDGKGMPSAMLNRFAVQYARSLDEMERILGETPRGIPRLWLVTSQDTARIYEFDSFSLYRIDAQDGRLVLTNHGRYLNFRDPSPSSLERYDFLSRSIAGHVSMDVYRLIELNRDQILYSSQGQDLGFTNLHSVVFVPGTLDFWVALGPPPATRGRWIGFSLSKELSGEGFCPDPAFFEAMY